MSMSFKTRLLLLIIRLTGMDGSPRLLGVEKVRERINKMARPAPLNDARLASIRDQAMDGPGGKLGLRIYTPKGEGPHPLLVFFHGGGFVVGDLNSHDDLCRRLAAQAGRVVVSVDYRLAPEHPFPAASDDCLAATRWAADHARELRADPARIVVAGDSAGGNLAAVTALRLRDEAGPRLSGQLLYYPVTDYFDPGTPSYRENAEGRLLTREAMVWFWEQYLSNPTQAADPRACPLRAPDLAGLPPALVLTAGLDPLRDEGEAYAQRMKAAGVEAHLTRYPHSIHGFMSMTGFFRESEPGLQESCAWLQGR
jgi:acetyl esterase